MISIQNKLQMEAVAQRLSELRDKDAPQAILECRQLRGVGDFKLPALGICAAILVDAGAAAQDRQAVLEGVKAFRKLRAAIKDNWHICYNLANGLSGLARLAKCPHSEWHVSTREERREARRILETVVVNTKSVKLRARASTNLGNELDAGYRWVEAYDEWVEALRTDPSNGVAALSAARMLIRRIKENQNHPKALHMVAGYYARVAVQHCGSIEGIAGPRAVELVRSLPTFQSVWQPPQLSEISDAFVRFVAINRLALVGTVEGLDLRHRLWDQLYISSISEGLQAGNEIPPVFAMMNQIKSDFCAARWLAYISRTNQPPETSIYGDTLDYAVYGIKPSLLVLAQRAALDVLDRVAVCANEYFSLGHTPNSVSFRAFWRDGGGTGVWRPELEKEIMSGNRGLIALGELASDLSDGGFLSSKSHLRNAGTHRFCVLHDLGNTPSRPSPAVEHFRVAAFFDDTLESLRVARSAILYLVDSIAAREKRLSSGKNKITLSVPLHHQIRGSE